MKHPQDKIPSNGQLVKVSFLDSSREEDVFVKLLPSRLYTELRRALQDEAKQAEIFSGRSAEFIDSLKPNSVEAVVLAGWSLNREHFNRMLSRSLENAAEEAAAMLEMIVSFSPSVLDLAPGVVEHYRELAAISLKRGLPRNDLEDFRYLQKILLEDKITSDTTDSPPLGIKALVPSAMEATPPKKTVHADVSFSHSKTSQ